MNEVRILISQGKTEQALDLLSQATGDALLLQAQYNNGKKQYNMGLIDFSEWQRIEARVVHGALEMSSKSTTVNIQQTTVIQINLSSTKSFTESLAQMDLPTLVGLITKEFKGKPAMEAWLPIKQEYDSFELLGKAFAPGYLTTVKEHLIKIYDEYWTKASTKAAEKIRSAVQAIYDSLQGERTEEKLKISLEEFQIFFHENPNYIGLKQMEEYDAYLEGGKMKLFKKSRPDSYKEEIDKMYVELIAVSNRILLGLEK